MLSIEDKTIKITRGDEGNINFSMQISDAANYTFKVGDTVSLNIYNKKGYDIPITISKVRVNTETTKVNIPITKENSSIGEVSQKPVTFWYDIKVNENQTSVGYDDDGPAQFIIFPGKVGE